MRNRKDSSKESGSQSKDELSREELECLIRFLESEAYPREFTCPFQGRENLGQKLHDLYRETVNEPDFRTTGERRRWSGIAK